MALSFERLGDIMLASDNGKHVSTLLHSHGSDSDGFGNSEPAWSADGRCLAFVFSTVLGGGNPDFRVRVLRGKVTVSDGIPAHEQGPSWEPDGRRIVFGDQESGGLVIRSVGTSADDVELTNGASDTAPAWSPDGATIAFERYDWTTRTSRIFLIGPDGSGQRQLTTTVGENPTWSHDSRRIAFDDGKRIAVINADGRGLKYLTKPRGWFDLDPAWSPGGRTIAFVRSRYDSVAGNIWMINPAGGGLHRYIRKNVGFPAWKPG